MAKKKNWNPLYPGQVIKYALEDTSLSIEEFASMIGAPIEIVNSILDGSFEMNDKQIDLVCKVLGLDEKSMKNLQRHYLISTGKLKVEDPEEDEV